MKIDPSEKKLFEVAEREYGVGYAMQMQNQYNQLNNADKAKFLSSNASNFVQNQAPCQNMNRKFYWFNIIIFLSFIYFIHRSFRKI